MEERLSYKGAGVDVERGSRLVGLIRSCVRATHGRAVIGDIGGFGGLFSGRFRGYRDPVLVSSTDGVGTKLKIAFMMKRHDTIGIDLVAMNVNDILTTGAKPLFFLDYVATGRLDVKTISTVIKGIARGCREAGCALLGGETAEMPGFYRNDEYDLAGFAVGVVERKRIIDGSRIRDGDVMIGIPSSGLHSNGYSLARKVIFERLNLTADHRPHGFRKTIGGELLTPTRIYVRTLLAVLKDFNISGMVHITGGGFVDNIPRVLPKGLKAVVRVGSWRIPYIFKFLQREGNIEWLEMFRTFNCGIGMILIVRARDKEKVLKRLKSLGEKAYEIGGVVSKKKGDGYVELVGL